MYKKQMKFQRLICFTVLAASVILFIYSLGFATDLYDALRQTMDGDSNLYDDKYVTVVKGAEIYCQIQPFNKNLTTAAIILIICSLALFVTNNHSRRKYYLANYITVGISSLANVGVAIWNIINVAGFKNQYLTTVDFEALKAFSEKWDTLYIDQNSTFWFDAGFIVSAILVVVSIINILNLIWKIKLMKDEAQIIKEGLEDTNA